MSVKIITDSTSYIEEGLRDDLDIKILPLSVTFQEKTIKETDIKNELFYEMMEEKGIPLSSQPSLVEMYKAMVEVVSKGDDLLCIFLSKDMSGTYNSAYGVREEVLKKYPDANIKILDSKTNSMQLGFAAIVAARAAKDGKNIDQVVKIAEENIKSSRFLFIPHNLKYLNKGGRIGGAGTLIGNILKIIPILTVEDGKTTVFKTVRTKIKAVNNMIDKVLEDDDKSNIEEIIVHHINSYDEADKLANKLRQKLNKTIPIIDIGPVIGMHVGPGSVGIAYYTENQVEN